MDHWNGVEQGMKKESKRLAKLLRRIDKDHETLFEDVVNDTRSNRFINKSASRRSLKR